MKKILNPIPFQGKKYLKKKKNYFEGWYFKISNQTSSIAFISGIQREEKKTTAFIQVITKDKSFYITYPIETFSYTISPFEVKIGNNQFRKDKIELNIKEEDIKLVGTISFKNNRNIKTSLFSPNIMGPFSYLPFLECNHAIAAMKNEATGKILLNEETFVFQKDRGYIEKDWGTSFPKKYIWLQGNQFKKKKTAFFLAIATIPFKLFSFQGLICSLLLDGKEYRFTTYNLAKVKEWKSHKDKISITLKKGKYTLQVRATQKNFKDLKAPKNGKMKQTVYESVDSSIQVELREKGKIIYQDKSSLCGFEKV